MTLLRPDAARSYDEQRETLFVVPRAQFLMIELARQREGCYDGAKAYRTPFVSGKDSLNNQFTTEEGETIRIPATLLVSGMGLIEDVDRCVTMDAKQSGNVLLLVGETTEAMGGSHAVMCCPGLAVDRSLPRTDLIHGPARAHAIAGLINSGLLQSAHDCSEGGLLVAAAEMGMAGGLGLSLERDLLEHAAGPYVTLFAETPSRYLLDGDWIV